MIATGKQFANAVDKAGNFYVWGRGEFGVFGFENKEVAQPIVNPVLREIVDECKTPIVKVMSCNDFTSILFSDGVIRSFGNNN